jgi:hypothetical protein
VLLIAYVSGSIPRFLKDQIFEEEIKEIINEKSRNYCLQAQERAREHCKKLGIDPETYAINNTKHHITKLKHQIAKKSKL